jgi:predicted ATPase/DNA-binding CsgD family transcriptional regulator
MSKKLELGLTPRELQVARLVRAGLTDRDIAGRLFITRRTAEWHTKQILNKLGFNSRSQVAAWVAHNEAVGSVAGSPNGHRHNLPLQLTTFVGRGTELADLQRLLAAKRFVTLTAVGGAGKTRLALEVASRAIDAYPDGAWLVDLTPIKDGDLVARGFGSTLGLHERPRQPIAETLLEHLRGRHLLLVVDNCEHVIADCAGLVDTILRSCPGVTLLATSREPLHVSGETVWRVAPLEVPDASARIDPLELTRYEAIDLFVDRAQLAAPGFEINAENASDIVELCRRLDGIPLAIELAAARAGLMSPDQILNRLQNRFGLLTGGSRAGPLRHRTMQSALDWSYDLLSDDERRLFRRLSVFAGSFSLEAVEQVCSDHELAVGAIAGLLGSLVDKSLVVASLDGPGPMRFRMLETLQQYGQERLAEPGEVQGLNRGHAEFFASVAKEASPKLRGRDQQLWHQRLALDLSNLRSALQWNSMHEPEAGLPLIIAMTDFWYIDGLVEEGDGWLKRALGSYPARTRLRAEALARGGLVSYWRDDIETASVRWHECLDIYHELDDRVGVGQGLRWLGELTEWQGDMEAARRYFDGSLEIAREANDETWIADILRQLGRLAMKEGDHEKARTHLQESLAYYERIGDHRFINVALGYLGLNAIDRGDLAAARTHLERGLAIARVLDFTIGLATPLMYFAALAAAQGHPSRALRLSGASEALAASAGGVATRLTRPLVERWLDKSRLELGVRRSAAYSAEGRAMSRERAVEYALKAPQK